MNKKVVVNGKKTHLRDSNYKAKGGQGSVFLKDNVIYKIYHNEKLLIPEQKIYELQSLKNIKNVIIPQEIIYSEQNKKIGFTLKYIDNSDCLCKLFTNSFKTRKNVSVKNISEIVDNMRETLIKIHENNIVVGDYNEMNFLIDNKFVDVFYIDTDSYQTKSFKCNAIMHQYRDRLLPLGTFTKGSDWFSWAIVTFRLYCGIHPYRGRHVLDFESRMNQNISIFDNSVVMPKNIDINIIPKTHLDYYKSVFVSNDRGVPPKSNGVFNISVKKKLYIDDTSDITAKLIRKYDEDIISALYKDSNIYVITKNNLYKNDEKLPIEQTSSIFYPISYKITVSGLAQITYETFGKNTITVNKIISSVAYNSSKLYDGVVLQDIYGKYTATILYDINKCSNLKIKELDNSRIIDAKYQNNWLFVVYERNLKIDCLVVNLINNYTGYESSIIENVDFLLINAVVKSNGVVIFNVEDCVLQLFNDLSGKIKVIKNTPIYNDYKLIELHKVCFFYQNELYELNNNNPSEKLQKG